MIRFSINEREIIIFGEHHNQTGCGNSSNRVSQFIFDKLNEGANVYIEALNEQQFRILNLGNIGELVKLIKPNNKSIKYFDTRTKVFKNIVDVLYSGKSPLLSQIEESLRSYLSLVDKLNNSQSEHMPIKYLTDLIIEHGKENYLPRALSMIIDAKKTHTTADTTNYIVKDMLNALHIAYSYLADLKLLKLLYKSDKKLNIVLIGDGHITNILQCLSQDSTLNIETQIAKNDIVKWQQSFPKE